MKGKLQFDLAAVSYGSATEGIRALLAEWEAIEWARPHGDEATATTHFEEHYRRCWVEAPNVFSAVPTPRVQLGGWGEFRSLRTRAYDDVGKNWDWKYAGLKELAKKHSERRDYKLEWDAVKVGTERMPRPGDLFFELPDGGCIWNFTTDYERDGKLTERQRFDLLWYVGYSTQDLTLALEWQLAERNSNLDSNPFVPLQRCVAEGFYPFMFQRDEVILFGFHETELPS